MFTTRIAPVYALIDFNVAVRREVPHARYADAVCEEIRVRAPDFFEQGAATTVYFGGGTPGMWPSEYIGQVLEKIDATAGIDPNAEITVEFNPEDATIERFRALKAVGVNRVSLGIQSFDDRVLNRLGRQHSGVTAQRSVDIVRRAGIDNLSIDLIHGLAEHPVEAALRDVERAVQLGPEHISTYQLTIEDKTAFGARARRGESLLISDEHLLDCIRLAPPGPGWARAMRSPRPVGLSLQQSAYWRGAPFLAAGAGAHGFWRGARPDGAGE